MLRSTFPSHGFLLQRYSFFVLAVTRHESQIFSRLSHILRQSVVSFVSYVHLTNFHIAGFGYWEGCEAFDQLKIGTKLELVREEDNAFDPYAVAIYYNDYKLGFIPRAHNHDISKYLDMGLHDIYEVRITRITPDVQPEQQVEVIVYILNQK